MDKNNTLKVLELFSGFECISNAFREKGHECFTIDWDERFPSTMHCDISKLQIKDLPEEWRHPDIVFLGFDCTTMSVAAISKHRRKNPETGNLDPISEKAKFADAMAAHCKELLGQLNPKIEIWENPCGGMRKMWYIQDLIRNETTYCFTGETEIITDLGFKSLFELDKKQVNVLNKNGIFEKGVVHNYGKQKIYKLTVQRARKQKEIYTTKEHQWFYTNYANPKKAKYKLCSTNELQKGMHLLYAQQPKKEFEIINEYVARGFIFGDGWVVKKEPSTGSHIQFVNDKIDMLPYFDGLGGKRWWDNTSTCKILKTCSMPIEWKTYIPKTTDDPSVIASWLAGYFAADGCIGKSTGQITISSSKEQDLIRVKELAESIGIQCLTINKFWRKGLGKDYSWLYQLTFSQKDFPKTMILREKHQKLYDELCHPKHVPQRWTVVSVEPTDRYEDVYCVETEDTHSFTLVDGIVTHNCQWGFTYRKATDFFSNIDLHLRPPCKNGDPCHEKAPRGARTGLQAIKDPALKAVYPPELCKHIVEECEKYIYKR